MIRCLRVLPGALALLLCTPAWGDTLPRMTPEAAYAQMARSGELQRTRIAGDLDAAKLKPPPGAKRLVLREVHVEGRLHASAGGPPLALHIIDRSRLANIDLRHTQWKAPLVIENSLIEQRAWFDGAQFDAAFVLHAATFSGQVLLRGVRFGGPVEITASRFELAAPISSSVAFTDARFAAPARFDRSHFATGVRFDTARFEADASFIGITAAGRASWRNVMFGGDAEFRFCRLAEADFGDAEQMSVFMRLADFRGCSMTALHLNYADVRGDLLLVNVQVAPGNVSLQQAALRGAQNDIRGLNVAGKLDLKGAQIGNLQLNWYDISAPLLRSHPGSDVLRPLQRRLDELKKDDEARVASAVLAERVIEERLARPDASPGDKALIWLERIVWGRATGYGTQLGRILGIALACWLLLALPLLLAQRLHIRALSEVPDKLPLLHQAVAATALQPLAASRLTRVLHKLGYAFGLMYTQPDLRLRPAAALGSGWRGYLLLMRGVGLGLLALIVLTLSKVSPIIQAVLGKIVN